MNYKDIEWKHMFTALNEHLWSSEVREIPVVVLPLGKNHLGDFEFSTDGFFNCIVLSEDAELTPKEMVGVLAHEMTHQLVFQKYGCEVEEHGKEWMDEITKIGFKDDSLDGLNFCDDVLFDSLLARHNELINDSERNI